MSRGSRICKWRARSLAVLLLLVAGGLAGAAQTKPPMAAKGSSGPAAQPKLVVLLVVDQFRADYVEKFRGQWSGGLTGLVTEGAWFRNAAYPYAATETCVGHATISTGAFPATHGMVANEWGDRNEKRAVTCTEDPKAKNLGYAGISVKGGDSGWRLVVPSFAEELRFQGAGATRVVTFSLKARAAIALAGHRADAVTWFDGAAGAWVTSDVYGSVPIVEEYAKVHPVKEDYGKTWTPLLPVSSYRYGEIATGAVPPEGWGSSLPHSLRGREESTEPDRAFYQQWQTSPYSDAYLERLAELSVDMIGLGQGASTDFLGVSFSALDYAGHAYGPRSHEVQDVLARLDRTLGALFAHLDLKVGRGRYVVAVSGDHGVAPIPADMQKTGADAGWFKIAGAQQSIEDALAPFLYPTPAVAGITGSDVYFAPGVYERLKSDPPAMHAVMEAIEHVPGVAAVYRAEEIQNRPASESPIRKALAASYFPGRSGDLFVVPKPYWAMDFSMPGQARRYGTTHGTPYFYDQRVPILLMGFGIRAGEYWTPVTPADIAPTLAALCGITLTPRDGHVLADALKTAAGAMRSALPGTAAEAPAKSAQP